MEELFKKLENAKQENEKLVDEVNTLSASFLERLESGDMMDEDKCVRFFEGMLDSLLAENALETRLRDFLKSLED